jgi:hypothetical protein
VLLRVGRHGVCAARTGCADGGTDRRGAVVFGGCGYDSAMDGSTGKAISMKPKSKPLTLTKPEADALANVGMIAALQMERGGHDVADLWRAVKKVAARRIT